MVHGAVRAWLRLEGLLAFAVALVLYAQTQRSWLLFGALFLLPDASFLGYLAGPRTGALVYNLAHSYAFPLALSLSALLFEFAGITAFALIWIAHIGFDRAVRYGLKYPTHFRDTHLGPIGGAGRASPSSRTA
jgi:hypothetical protein